MIVIFRKIKSFVNYLRVFRSVKDIRKYRGSFEKSAAGKMQEVALRVKETNDHDLFCRYHTTDPNVLWDTFYYKYHLPPLPLPENAVILDLGANVGYTMAHFAYRYPQARIFGVEMEEGNYLQIKKNIASLGDRCQVMQAAVWSEDGQITYDDSDGEWGFRVMEGKGDANPTRRAPAKKLSTIINEFGLGVIDYVKMDIEGAEKNVLDQAELWIGNIKMIKIEVHAPMTKADCSGVLTKWGFAVSDDRYHPFTVIGIKDQDLTHQPDL